MRTALRDVFGFLRDYHEMATLILLQLLALGILLHLDNAGGNVALFCAFLLIVQLLALYLIYRIFKRAQRRVDEQINQAYLQKQLEFQEDHLFALRQMESDFDEIRRKLEPQLDELDHSEPKDADSILTRLLGYCMKLCQNAYSENKIIDAILYAKVRRAQEQDIDIHVQVMVPQTLPIRDADLIAVCVNLLDNAIDALQEVSDRRLTLTLTEDLKAFRFSVKNSGPMIPVKLQASIFQPGITTKAAGHGMGLFIVRRTVQEWGGDIRLISDAKETEFSGFIPREVKPQDKTKKEKR